MNTGISDRYAYRSATSWMPLWNNPSTGATSTTYAAAATASPGRFLARNTTAAAPTTTTTIGTSHRASANRAEGGNSYSA